MIPDATFVAIYKGFVDSKHKLYAGEIEFCTRAMAEGKDEKERGALLHKTFFDQLNPIATAGPPTAAQVQTAIQAGLLERMKGKSELDKKGDGSGFLSAAESFFTFMNGFGRFVWALVAILMLAAILYSFSAMNRAHNPEGLNDIFPGIFGRPQGLPEWEEMRKKEREKEKELQKKPDPTP